MVRLLETVEIVGLEQLREPHVGHLVGKLWELRAKSKDGIARDNFCYSDGAAGRGVARIRQDIAKDATPSVSDGQGTDETGETMAELKDLKWHFMKAPAFGEEYV